MYCVLCHDRIQAEIVYYYTMSLERIQARIGLILFIGYDAEQDWSYNMSMDRIQARIRHVLCHWIGYSRGLVMYCVTG